MAGVEERVMRRVEIPEDTSFVRLTHKEEGMEEKMRKRRTREMGNVHDSKKGRKKEETENETDRKLMRSVPV